MTDDRILERRQARLEAAPAFLRGGFRLFFLGGAAWAVIALVLWLLAFTGGAELPTAFDPLAWHRHEMLFGFVGAVVAGFLTAAIPNWTGRPPIAGMPVAALFGLWLAGRAGVLFSGIIGAPAAGVVDVLFYGLFAAIAAREVLAARNRNLPVVVLVLLLGLACTLDHLGSAGKVEAGLGSRGGIALVVLMITLIGGRIVPAFTRNWLVKHGTADRLPPPHGLFDGLVIGATATAFINWVPWPETRSAGIMLAAAGVLQAVRLSRWRGLSAMRDPLVFVLHIGYAWIPAGLMLLGASLLGASIVLSAAIHALTAGAMASMILAVMTRATLGHTGRELKAGAATIIIYGLVSIGALLRVVTSSGFIPYTGGMEVSALFWGGAFVLFILAYGPMLMRARVDGRVY
jgi:uncharacterized protein involved in response to NO